MNERVIRRLLDYLKHATAVHREPASEAELLQHIQAGGELAASAVELLVRRHADMVFAICLRYLHDEQEAEDVFQDTFCELIQSAERIECAGAIEAWLRIVACRKAAAARRRKRTLWERILPVVCWRVNRETEKDVHEEEAAAEVAGSIRDALAELPQKYLAVLELRYLKGKSIKETAAILNIPVGTVQSQTAKAKKLLRKICRRRGMAVSLGVLTAGLCAGRGVAGPPVALVEATIKTAALLATKKSLMAGTTAFSGKLIGLLGARPKLKVAIALLLVLSGGMGLGLAQLTSNETAPIKAPVPREDEAALAEKQRLQREQHERRLETKLKEIAPRIEKSLSQVFPSSSAKVSLVEMVNNGEVAHVVADWKPLALMNSSVVEFRYQLPSRWLDTSVDFARNGEKKSIDWERGSYMKPLFQPDGPDIELFGKRQLREVYEVFNELNKVP